MSDWACTRCGAINLDGQRACEGCGKEPEGRPRAVGVGLGSRTSASAEPAASRPCTEAQNKAALKITLDVHRGAITAAEGRCRMVELFGMPELEHET